MCALCARHDTPGTRLPPGIHLHRHLSTHQRPSDMFPLCNACKYVYHRHIFLVIL